MIVTLSELKSKQLCITKSLVEEKTNKTITKQKNDEKINNKQQNATRKIKTPTKGREDFRCSGILSHIGFSFTHQWGLYIYCFTSTVEMGIYILHGCLVCMYAFTIMWRCIYIFKVTCISMLEMLSLYSRFSRRCRCQVCMGHIFVGLAVTEISGIQWRTLPIMQMAGIIIYSWFY